MPAHPPDDLVRAIRTLAAVCDGAHDADGIGFNATDTGFGRRLAATPPEAWGEQVTRRAWEVAGKYRHQLARAGIEWADIPEPPGTASHADIRAVDYENGRFVVRFGYEPRLVSAVKRLPSVRWDPDGKTWTVPLRGASVIGAWADEHGFILSSAAREAVAAPGQAEAAPVGTADADDRGIILRFDYDPALVTEVRHLSRRTWDPEMRVWRLPVESVREVRAFAAAHGFARTAAFDAIPDTEPDLHPGVEVSNGQFVIRFPYDRDLISRVRDLPSARWSRALWGWVVDLEAAIEVAEFVEATDGRVRASAVEALTEAKAALERIAESAARDAELEVHGLGGELMPFQRAGVAYILRALGLHPEEQDEEDVA